MIAFVAENKLPRASKERITGSYPLFASKECVALSIKRASGEHKTLASIEINKKIGIFSIKEALEKNSIRVHFFEYNAFTSMSDSLLESIY